MVKTLRLAQIRTDGNTQIRVSIDQIVVDDYATAMRAGAAFPAVVVFFDGDDYWLADGFHRVRAAHEAERKAIRAEVRKGSRRDALLYAVGANATHGLRRTNLDKRRAVLILLQDREWKKWSDREVARHCGVSNRFVSNVRRELCVNRAQLVKTERRATRNGKTYTIQTARIGAAQRLTPDVRAALRDSPVALVDRPAVVAQLSRLPPDQQPLVAVKLLSGEAKSVQQARRLIEAEAIDREAPAWPSGRFHVLVADPPWRFDHRNDDATRRNALAYPTLTVDEIKALPVGGLAAENAVLWLWSTNAHLPHACGVLEAWGFSYKTVLTWVKHRMGTGDYLRSQTEHCLLGVRGRPVLTLRSQTTALHAKARDHSRKPDEFMKMVESLCPGSKVELFARIQRPGWVCYGRGLESVNGTGPTRRGPKKR